MNEEDFDVDAFVEDDESYQEEINQDNKVISEENTPPSLSKEEERRRNPANFKLQLDDTPVLAQARMTSKINRYLRHCEQNPQPKLIPHLKKVQEDYPDFSPRIKAVMDKISRHVYHKSRLNTLLQRRRRKF